MESAFKAAEKKLQDAIAAETDPKKKAKYQKQLEELENKKQETE